MKPSAQRSTQLAKLVSEANRLLVLLPTSLRMRDAVCIVWGYTDLYFTYKLGTFPWAYLDDILLWMKHRTQRLADANDDPPLPTFEAYEIRVHRLASSPDEPRDRLQPAPKPGVAA